MGGALENLRKLFKTYILILLFKEFAEKRIRVNVRYPNIHERRIDNNLQNESP